MTQLDRLRARVCAANRRLPAEGLTVLTWGNVSALDRESGLMVIKPSGIPYPELTPESMVIVDMAGRVVEGRCRPSSDTATHLALYGRFPAIGSIVHTHSPWATVWAQLGRPIPPLGTTHADDFGAEILCSRPMTPEEIRQDYEANTGRVIAEALSERDFARHFAVLVRGHGPFVWDTVPEKAVEKAVALEFVAMEAWHCLVADPALPPLDGALLNRHFLRKHGADAYYGQKCRANQEPAPATRKGAT